jgi:hypothetical protein
LLGRAQCCRHSGNHIRGCDLGLTWDWSVRVGIVSIAELQAGERPHSDVSRDYVQVDVTIDVHQEGVRQYRDSRMIGVSNCAVQSMQLSPTDPSGRRGFSHSSLIV